jgi:segregation and condensation protein B
LNDSAPLDFLDSGHVSLLGALLFASPEPISPVRLAEAAGLSAAHVKAAMPGVRAAASALGLTLLDHNGTLELATDPAFALPVEQLLGVGGDTKLSAAALETLAVIAYRQPVSRGQIEQVRGVNADRVVATLVARGLVEEVGRADSIGRPALFGTTIEFLEQLGLASLEELTPLPALATA